jgi:class 3 adenylate cyclase
VKPPRTHYARNGEISIAYQVYGAGPVDLVFIPSWASHLEHLWAHPGFARMMERMGSFARVILFDRRGSGLSDRVDPGPLETQVDDVRAVMRAAGSARAVAWAETEGTAMAALFAASHPELVSALALYTPMPKIVAAPDWPWGADPDIREDWIKTVQAHWGDGSYIGFLAPSLMDDDDFREWAARLERYACGPGAVPAALRQMAHNDVREVLPLIGVPTLVMHRPDEGWIDQRHAHYVVDNVPDCKLVELPGSDALVLAGDVDAPTDAIEEFVTGTRRSYSLERVLATVLFTDIVDSTRRAASMGDARWIESLDEHRALVRAHLTRYGGREVKTLGDGFLATFDGPARGVRCAIAIAESSRETGLDIRAGVHTGECDFTGNDVTGIAVHIASRVLGHAGPGEVVVSRTVVDLVAGSQLAFEERGTHELKGVPGAWQLYAAAVEPANGLRSPPWRSVLRPATPGH